MQNQNHNQKKEKNSSKKESKDVKICDDSEVITMSKGVWITAAQVIKNHNILKQYIKREDIIGDRNVDKNGRVLSPNVAYTNREILYVYLKLREFEGLMKKQDKMFHNGKISGIQYDKISESINIGRNGKSLQSKYKLWTCVTFKETVIGKLFCDLKGDISINTDSQSTSTS